jgi:hypothetical protein
MLAGFLIFISTEAQVKFDFEKRSAGDEITDENGACCPDQTLGPPRLVVDPTERAKIGRDFAVSRELPTAAPSLQRRSFTSGGSTDQQKRAYPSSALLCHSSPTDR